MIFRIVLALLVAGLVFCESALASFVLANNPRIKTMGRWISADNGSKYAGRGAVQVSAEFEGTGVQVQMYSDSQNDVWWLKKLDDGQMVRFKAQMGTNVLYQNLPQGKHRLLMIRDTEGLRGVTILRGFYFVGESEAAAAVTPVSNPPVAGQGAAVSGNATGNRDAAANSRADFNKRIAADKDTGNAEEKQKPKNRRKRRIKMESKEEAKPVTPQPPVQRKPHRRYIEIFGDSVAAGAFIYPEGDYFRRESGYFAFGPLLARMVNADWSCVANSGEGAVRNNEEKPPYSAKHAEEQIERAFYTQKEPRWSNQMDDPDLVILAYGENDFNDPVNRPSDDYFKDQYKKLILRVRQFRPDAVIFCMTPANAVTSQRSVPGMGGAVAELRAAGDSKVFFIDLNAHGPLLNRSDFLDGVHPLVSGHVKIALHLKGHARAVLGWN